MSIRPIETIHRGTSTRALMMPRKIVREPVTAAAAGLATAELVVHDRYGSIDLAPLGPERIAARRRIPERAT
jgi:hypothetical protein